MSSPDRSSPTPSWVDLYLRDFEDLLRVVELSSGFVLQPVEIPGPDLARALGDWLSAHGHPVLVREPRDDSEWREITGWLLEEAKPPPGGVVMVIGSRDPPEGVYLGLRLVNERRDAIGARLGCLLFWCGPASFLRLTKERAPDFWSVRAVERRLEPAKLEHAPEIEEEVPQDDLLEEALRQGDMVSVARIALQRARATLLAGKLDEVEALLDKVPGVGDKALDSELTFFRAEVARRRGRLAEALAMLSRLRENVTDHSLACRIELSAGRAYESTDEVSRAQGSYDKAALAARDADDDALKLLASLLSDALHFHSGEHPRLWLDSMGWKRDHARASGDRALEALATALLAQAAVRMHDRERAQRLIRDARDLVNRAYGQPTVLLGGEVDEAVEAAERALLGARIKLSGSSIPTPDRQRVARSIVVLLAAIVSSAVVSLLLYRSLIAIPHAGALPFSEEIWCFAEESGRVRCAPTRLACEHLLPPAPLSTRSCQKATVERPDLDRPAP